MKIFATILATVLVSAQSFACDFSNGSEGFWQCVTESGIRANASSGVCSSLQGEDFWQCITESGIKASVPAATGCADLTGDAFWECLKQNGI